MFDKSAYYFFITVFCFIYCLGVNAVETTTKTKHLLLPNSDLVITMPNYPGSRRVANHIEAKSPAVASYEFHIIKNKKMVLWFDVMELSSHGSRLADIPLDRWKGYTVENFENVNVNGISGKKYTYAPNADGNKGMPIKYAYLLVGKYCTFVLICRHDKGRYFNRILNSIRTHKDGDNSIPIQAFYKKLQEDRKVELKVIVKEKKEMIQRKMEERKRKLELAKIKRIKRLERERKAREEQIIAEKTARAKRIADIIARNPMPDRKIDMTGDAIYKYASPAVVVIKTDKCVGSGFIFMENMIITNYHVIKDALWANAHFIDGNEEKITAVLSYDVRRDVAVLGINGRHACLWLSSKTVSPGATAYAIGAPAGFEFTITKGTVSALRNHKRYGLVIQHDAEITNGSSGGPLLDKHGYVIGINTFGEARQMALEKVVFKFAITSTEIKTVLATQCQKTSFAKFAAPNIERDRIIRKFKKKGYNALGSKLMLSPITVRINQIGGYEPEMEATYSLSFSYKIVNIDNEDWKPQRRHWLAAVMPNNQLVCWTLVRISRKRVSQFDIVHCRGTRDLGDISPQSLQDVKWVVLPYEKHRE